MECSTRGASWSCTIHWSRPESPCPDQVLAGFSVPAGILPSCGHVRNDLRPVGLAGC